MVGWGFWEWLAYAGIAIAAIMLALDAGVKQSPDLNLRFAWLLANRVWAFTPFVLILVSAVAIAITRFTTHSPTTPYQAASRAPTKTSLAKPPHLLGHKPSDKRVFVNFGADHLATLKTKLNTEEAMALDMLYDDRWMKLSGIVESVDVSADEGEDTWVNITFRATREHVLVCSSNGPDASFAATVQRGMKLTMVGQINSLNTQLFNCQVTGLSAR